MLPHNLVDSMGFEPTRRELPYLSSSSLCDHSHKAAESNRHTAPANDGIEPSYLPCCPKSGRGDRIRTYGLTVPNRALNQTQLHPDIVTTYRLDDIWSLSKLSQSNRTNLSTAPVEGHPA